MMPIARKYKAISLFSGAGGFDLGVHQSGFDILTCIEIDPNACTTLREAHLNDDHATKVIEEDIRQVQPDRLLKEFSMLPGELDLLFGGSPCQSFSQMGKLAGINDERGLLIFEFVRFARTLLPKVILIEQVKGILSAKDSKGVTGGVLNLLVMELTSLGYHVQYKVLNSADYGIPQVRERVFLIASSTKGAYHFPLETHAGSSEGSLFQLKPWQTLRDALHDLREPTQKGEPIPLDSHFDITPRGDRMRIAGVPEGQNLSSQLHLPAAQRGKLTKKDTTKFRRLAWNKPSLTLRCGETFYHPVEDRYLTPREYMRIHGYPDSYLIYGPIRGRTGTVKTLDQHRLIANSVPPPLAYLLGESIISRCLNGQIEEAHIYASNI